MISNGRAFIRATLGQEQPSMPDPRHRGREPRPEGAIAARVASVIRANRPYRTQNRLYAARCAIGPVYFRLSVGQMQAGTVMGGRQAGTVKDAAGLGAP